MNVAFGLYACVVLFLKFLLDDNVFLFLHTAHAIIVKNYFGFGIASFDLKVLRIVIYSLSYCLLLLFHFCSTVMLVKIQFYCHYFCCCYYDCYYPSFSYYC